ncbi:MAG: 50S ribosomal protein L35ae [Candidatus Bathyarchaeia archaeon]
MRAKLVGHRLGPKTQRPREYILKAPGVESAREASQLIGRKVVWRGGKRPIVGKIVGVHGDGGSLRARFRKGVPGTAYGSKVDIV